MKRYGGHLSILFLLVMVRFLPAYEIGSEEGLAAKLDNVEADVETFRDQLGELEEEVAAIADDDTIVHSGTSKSTMKVYGRIHIDYWGFPDESPGINAIEGGPDGVQNRVGFRRLRFGVKGDLPANMEYKIEAEFAGGNNIEFRDAYLGWNDLPVLRTLLVGNQKRPYGLDHLNSSRYNVFLERPYVIESFNQDCRRLGIQSYGVSEDQAWNWRYGIFNQRLIQDEGNYVGNHLQGEFAARLANTWWYDEVSDGRGYGHWAVSGTYARPDGNVPGDNGSTGPDANEARFRQRPEARSATRWIDTGRIAGADEYELLGLEGVFNVGPFQMVGEYQNMWLQREAGFGPDLRLHGNYAYISYFLTGEHIPWSRKSGTLGRVKPFEDFFLVNRCSGGHGYGIGAWQVAVRYSYADFNDEDLFGGIGESITVGLNWHWSSNARLQFNWLSGTIEDNRVTRGIPLSGNYDIVGVRWMVDF